MGKLLSDLQLLDSKLSEFIYKKGRGVPRGFLKLLEFSGDGRLWISAIPALWIGHPLPIFRWLFLNIFIGLLLDLIVTGSFKSLIRRPRPLYNKGMTLVLSVDQWSFPSGHSSRAFFLAASFCIFTLNMGFAHIANWVIAIIVVWSILTSSSRILLGRHYLFDVMAGAVFGILEAVSLCRFLTVSENASEEAYFLVMGPSCRRIFSFSTSFTALCK